MSRSIRKETSSLAFGIVGPFVGSSAGFVVATLNAASAASREVVVLRVLSAGILCPPAGFTCFNANWAVTGSVSTVALEQEEGAERRKHDRRRSDHCRARG